MKPIFTMIVLAAALSAGSAAQAADVVGVTVTGAITGTTCSIRTTDLTFPLGNVERDTLPNNGSTSPLVVRHLVSNGCDATSVRITAAGTPAPSTASLFAVTGGATGVGVELFANDTGDLTGRLVPNSSTGVVVAPAVNNGQYTFSARYHRHVSAPLVRGDARSSATITLDYL